MKTKFHIYKSGMAFEYIIKDGCLFSVAGNGICCEGPVRSELDGTPRRLGEVLEFVRFGTVLDEREIHGHFPCNHRDY